ncbi:tRNA-dihydrouridine(47) synthase [NAD(P)(+)]-like [Tetrabaena socialis]|uniref:tRNA-dihydrouridine(47) synthase [NAD(P)(+)] n=1 Tax=Tetrabaena socialis TaxID=47790 RepID=A0A2J7ZSV4_9CHLO|nr:tRNA-dihydrouridine(47) synthase [NAD(P)(+)]-like [Tetrabaena socialis]|eukprot:PNH03346.1 tRNA-dihydrouridine(47) synthase [NAD(P)(+)]-like [Tetrabaena socialis]
MGLEVAHTFLHRAGEWGAAAVTLHGRTRQQRYAKLADWDYIERCGASCSDAGLQLIGNGDVLSYTDWNAHMRTEQQGGGRLASLMIGRGALIKPWIFTEIKEQRHWDISATERMDLFRLYCSAGLEHWGSDVRGVETTRRFLLEWLSFTCRRGSRVRGGGVRVCVFARIVQIRCWGRGEVKVTTAIRQ